MSKAPIRKAEAIASKLGDVRKQIRIMIQNGELPAGERVNEQGLATQLGIGRNAAREALRSLEQAGLVRIIPNRGAEVRRLSLEEALDLYELRAGLARTAGKLIALRLTAKEERALSALMTQMGKAVSLRDPARYHALNTEFHRQLMEATKSSRLIEVNQAIQDELKLYLHKGVLSPAQMQASHREHGLIFAAVRSGDSELAAKAFEAHILTGKKRMLDTLSTTGGSFNDSLVP
jgi:DNA-binding GntR family transcriptional regulator